MSEDTKCDHCHHLVIVMTKVSLVEKLLAIALVGTFGLLATLMGQFMSNRLHWSAPPASASERMFLDRVNKPDAPEKDYAK